MKNFRQGTAVEEAFEKITTEFNAQESVAIEVVEEEYNRNGHRRNSRQGIIEGSIKETVEEIDEEPAVEEVVEDTLSYSPSRNQPLK